MVDEQDGVIDNDSEKQDDPDVSGRVKRKVGDDEGDKNPDQGQRNGQDDDVLELTRKAMAVVEQASQDEEVVAQAQIAIFRPKPRK